VGRSGHDGGVKWDNGGLAGLGESGRNRDAGRTGHGYIGYVFELCLKGYDSV